MRSPTRKTELMRRGVNRALFVDKLCERWLTERVVVTLYELAIPRLPAAVGATLEKFRGQEQLHAEMLEQLLLELGHEPRSEPSTPSVNLAASEMEALIELARDERLEARHVLEVLQAAELLDGGGWTLLVELGKEVDLEDEWLRSFRTAHREEEEHQHVVRELLLRYERSELEASRV